jgi:ABC-type amino acid transport substrate-binding protein
MDADRLLARLHELGADVEPPVDFVEGLHDELAARLGFAAGEGIGSGHVLAPRRDRRAIVIRRFAILAAAALLLAALLANAAAIGALVDRLLQPVSLLDDARSSGLLRIAVSPDAPQIQTPARGIDGFDIDVAHALADRLGVPPEVKVTTAAEMLAAPGSGWQVAIPGIGIDPAATTDLLVTQSYYRWPVYLVTAAGSPSAGGLSPGATVCVVAGSPGAAWASGSASGPSLEVRTPATKMTVDIAPDERTCIDRVESGEVDAMVTSTLLPSDFETSGRLVPIESEPVAVEPRVIAVPAIPGASPLRDALDNVIADLRADGTLADLARARFGTDDVVRLP